MNLIPIILQKTPPPASKVSYSIYPHCLYTNGKHKLADGEFYLSAQAIAIARAVRTWMSNRNGFLRHINQNRSGVMMSRCADSAARMTNSSLLRDRMVWRGCGITITKAAIQNTTAIGNNLKNEGKEKMSRKVE